LKSNRSTLPAITHVDFSARIQTVDAQRHTKVHQVLRQFEAKTGCPVIINTSFNVRGEPIVCTPQEAYRCFMSTNIDALVLGNCFHQKRAKKAKKPKKAENYFAVFKLNKSQKKNPPMALVAFDKNPPPATLRWFGLIQSAAIALL